MSASFCTKNVLQLRNATAHSSAMLGKIRCLLYPTEEQKSGKWVWDESSMLVIETTLSNSSFLFSSAPFYLSHYRPYSQLLHIGDILQIPIPGQLFTTGRNELINHTHVSQEENLLGTLHSNSVHARFLDLKSKSNFPQSTAEWWVATVWIIFWVDQVNLGIFAAEN